MNNHDQPVVAAPDGAEPPHADNPATLLAAHYQASWEHGEADLAECNAALAVESIGFARCDGDWLGVVVTPWFLRLFLLPGGGRLWGDIPVGQRRYLDLPGGTLPFIAESIAGIGACQYSTLIAPISLVADMTAARRIAADTLQAFVGRVPSPVVDDAVPAVKPGVSRRAFFRRLAGRH